MRNAEKPKQKVESRKKRNHRDTETQRGHREVEEMEEPRASAAGLGLFCWDGEFFLLFAGDEDALADVDFEGFVLVDGLVEGAGEIGEGALADGDRADLLFDAVLDDGDVGGGAGGEDLARDDGHEGFAFSVEDEELAEDALFVDEVDLLDGGIEEGFEGLVLVAGIGDEHLDGGVFALEGVLQADGVVGAGNEEDGGGNEAPAVEAAGVARGLAVVGHLEGCGRGGLEDAAAELFRRGHEGAGGGEFGDGLAEFALDADGVRIARLAAELRGIVRGIGADHFGCDGIEDRVVLVGFVVHGFGSVISVENASSPNISTR